ncbi:hypothetical protein BGZ70_001428 [Mortierella alpina]|uniref:AD domain-containing protein n=1 Tax=Mortierella alpina TaxID=64518 RepID=A0A9P6IW45_MORAP|nr:hypothetical protein BGZ70_001428 [Mortierella alpina]
MAQAWRFFGSTLRDIYTQLGSPCHATLLNGKTYSGYLYNVDPETETLLILQLHNPQASREENLSTEQGQTDPPLSHAADAAKQDVGKRTAQSMVAVSRQAAKDFHIDSLASDRLTLQEMDSLARVLSNLGNPEDTKARKDRLVASLQAKRIPVETSEDDAVVHILNCAHVRPPYNVSSIDCDNRVVRERVKGMIQDMQEST